MSAVSVAAVGAAARARRTASNTINERSSRSHAVLQLSLRTPDGAPHGRLALVDLAGSERATDTQEADRDARVVVIGDTDVLTDQLIAQIPPNLDLGLGLIQWGIRREGLVAVSERTIEQDRVELNDYGRRVALAWPLGMALLSLVCGGLVWWTRRR